MAGIRHNRTYIATMQISFPTISGNRVRNFAVQLAGLPNASVEERVLATVNAAMRNHNMLGITEINDPFPEYADSGSTSFKDIHQDLEGMLDEMTGTLDEIDRTLDRIIPRLDNMLRTQEEMKAKLDEIIRILGGRNYDFKNRTICFTEMAVGGEN